MSLAGPKMMCIKIRLRKEGKGVSLLGPLCRWGTVKMCIKGSLWEGWEGG